MSAVLSPGALLALKREHLAILEEQHRRLMGNRLVRYRPYAKQQEFHAAGAEFQERLLMAGNQLGKTWSAAYEMAMHLTGRYPDWWVGRRWDRAVRCWGAGRTSDVVRESMQLLLMGEFSNIGTGSIPRDAIRSYTLKRGTPETVDTIFVKHESGGVSRLTFKSYDAGREKFQAATLDLVWLDEEPDYDIYDESKTRTTATAGMVMLTFTPLKGMTATVKRFLVDKAPGTHVTTMTIYDAGHFTPEQREAIIAGYPAHTRKARAMGIPTLGSGQIYPIDEEAIKIAPFPIPDHWRRIGGIDFGWTHPSAAVELAWDLDTDVIYVTKAARRKEVTPLLFSAEIKPWGSWLPWAWPGDGLQSTSANGGRPIAEQYRDLDMQMLEEAATHPPVTLPDGSEKSGGNAVDPGLVEILGRMETNRFRVFSNLDDWFEEFRMYHRVTTPEGGVKIHKFDDDLMDATRYAYMMRRHAISKPAARKAFVQRNRLLA